MQRIASRWCGRRRPLPRCLLLRSQPGHAAAYAPGRTCSCARAVSWCCCTEEHRWGRKRGGQGAVTVAQAGGRTVHLSYSALVTSVDQIWNASIATSCAGDSSASPCQKNESPCRQQHDSQALGTERQRCLCHAAMAALGVGVRGWRPADLVCSLPRAATAEAGRCSPL